MSLVGFKAQNHPQQTVKPQVDDRGTPPELFDPLNDRFHFTLDVAAAPHNAKCEQYLTIDDDSLAFPWTGERVWCNPPYSDIRPWVEKAWKSFAESFTPDLVVMLLPANRTEQGWWQDLIEPYRDGGQGFTVEFIRGRQRFIQPGQTEVLPNQRPPFGVCLVIWERK